MNKPFNGFSLDAIELMHEYRWPGNIRQLENLIHSLVILNDGPEITAKILGGGLQDNSSSVAPVDANEKPAQLQIIKGEFKQDQVENPRESALANPMEIKPLWLMEKEFIENAINQCAGNITKAAVLLEISPSTIYRKQQSWKK